MALLKRVRVAWSGWPGGPGVSTFYFGGDAAPPLADLRTLFTSVGGIIPTGIVLQVENVGQVIDTATGKAVSGWSAPAVLSITGSGGTSYSGPSGGVITWKSGSFLNGREMRGRTFLVPLATVCYDTTGTLATANVNAMKTAINTFLAAGGSAMRLYSRRSAADAAVTSGDLVDKAVVLRSRRQ